MFNTDIRKFATVHNHESHYDNPVFQRCIVMLSYYLLFGLPSEHEASHRSCVCISSFPHSSHVAGLDFTILTGTNYEKDQR
jgi:hypothetical protein